MQLIVEHILKKNSIVEYLKNKGHHPVHQSAGRLFYNCMLPGHSESKPSFVVWTNAAYENFYCFGCCRSFNIINLISIMENLSYSETVKRLSHGIDISPMANIEHVLKKIAEEYEQQSPFVIPDLLLEMSSMCRLYIQSVNNDINENRIIDNIYKSIDSDLINYKFLEIEETFRNLPMVLAKRQEKWLKNQNASL